MLNVISKLQPKDAEASSTKAPWGPTKALLGMVASFFGAQFLIGLIFAVFIAFEGWSPEYADNWVTESIVGQFVLLFSTSVLSLAILYPFMAAYSKQDILQGLGLTKPRLKIIGYALAAVAVYFGIYAVITVLADQFTPVNVDQEQNIGFESAQSTSSLIWTYVSLAIIPPIVEEIMFRGFLYGGLRKHTTVLWSAIITAIIFAAPHATQSTDGGVLWIAAIDTFILSLVLTYLREKTTSIYAGMIVHAVKNSVAFLFVFILAK